MKGFKTMDKAEYVARMQAECRRITGLGADAVNDAPTGNVISGSEMQVRDLMEELRHKAFELAVQMRVDSPESTFSPSEGHTGEGPAAAGGQEGLGPKVQADLRFGLLRSGSGPSPGGGHAASGRRPPTSAQTRRRAGGDVRGQGTCFGSWMERCVSRV